MLDDLPVPAGDVRSGAADNETGRSLSGSTTFLQDLQFDFENHDGGVRGSVTITPEMLAFGSDQVSLGVLATVVDVLMGAPLSALEQRSVSLTVDLVVRLLEPFGLGTYRTESRTVKPGRRFSVSEATIFDGDRPVAHSLATFVPVVVPESMPDPRDTVKTARPIGTGGTLGGQFADALGIRHEALGVASVGRHPYTMQPSGTIQGGVICTLVESAAQSRLGTTMTDIDVRFLSAVRVGPARATATALDDATARVTVTDAGGDPTRPTAFAIARARR